MSPVRAKSQFGAVLQLSGPLLLSSRVPVYEREVSLAVPGLEEPLLLKSSIASALWAQRFEGVVMVMIVKLDFSETSHRHVVKNGEDRRIALFARIKPAMLRRTAVTIAMARSQRPVAIGQSPHAIGVIVGFEVLGHEEEDMRGCRASGGVASATSARSSA
jgi:hypothetical protein